jgi:hypothetical protein
LEHSRETAFEEASHERFLERRSTVKLTGNPHAADVRHTQSNQSNGDFSSEWIVLGLSFREL